MRQSKAAVLSAVAVIAVIFAVNYFIPRPVVITNVVVTRVVDGDTIVVEGGETVRLLDIDTPERGKPCYSNATGRLEQLIGGREVTLVSGAEDRDKYGRMLRYAFINDTMINLVLVREGFANLYIFNKDPRYYQYLIDAEQAAKVENLCVWGT